MSGSKKKSRQKGTRASASASRSVAAPKPQSPKKPQRKKLNWRLLASVVAIVVLVGIVAFFASAQATDASTFCGTCHEMQPYYDAWTQGGHKTQAQCVDCHVDAGIARYTHKFVALGEVWSHVTGYGGFPLPAPVPIPDSRCLRCHQTITPKGMPASFSHVLHAKQGPCEMCHATTGHDVSDQALQAAGIFNARNAAMRVRTAGAAAVPGSGKANIPGHNAVSCSQCHDMAAMACSACHAAPHESRGQCQLCHAPGPKFTFQHPATQMPNSRNIACNKCHPVSYAQVNCTCHKNGPPRGD